MLMTDKNQLLRILLHILFWMFSWLFFVFYYIRYVEFSVVPFIAASINLIIVISTVYTFNYYLIPNYLLKNRIVKFSIFSVLGLILFIYLELLMTTFLTIQLLFSQQKMFPGMIDAIMLFSNLFFIVLIAISIKLYKRWNDKEHRSQIIQKEKVEAELQMLKTQINPHFLFNTLNSIYVLALKNSKQTAETVLRLSDLLDYILYKIDSPNVLLSDEIIIVKNYIELEKIRFASRLELNLEIDVKSSQIKIPPMLIIPFVENAFKHGVAKSIEKSWIRISIIETNSWLEIEIVNSKNQEAKANGGIGIENTQRRLKLIFGENYKFVKTESNNKYQVNLHLPKTK